MLANIHLRVPGVREQVSGIKSAMCVMPIASEMVSSHLSHPVSSIQLPILPYQRQTGDAAVGFGELRHGDRQDSKPCARSMVSVRG